MDDSLVKVYYTIYEPPPASRGEGESFTLPAPRLKGEDKGGKVEMVSVGEIMIKDFSWGFAPLFVW